MSESHQYFSMGGFPYQFLLFKASRRLKSFDECCLAHTSAPKEQNPGHRITKQMLSIHLWERIQSCSGGFSHVLSLLNWRLAHLFVSWWGFSLPVMWDWFSTRLNFLSSSKLEQLSLLELRDRPEADIEILEFRLKLLNVDIAIGQFIET